MLLAVGLEKVKRNIATGGKKNGDEPQPVKMNQMLKNYYHVYVLFIPSGDRGYNQRALCIKYAS